MVVGPGSTLEKVTNPALDGTTFENVGSSKSQKIIKCPLIDSICAGLQAAKDKLVQESILFFNNFIEEYQKHLPSINTLILFGILSFEPWILTISCGQAEKTTNESISARKLI